MFRFGYTGREQDGETGLDYYRARYYDSVVGRFISEDPIGFRAGDANLYRYVFNSPTNFVDPSGEGVPFIIGGKFLLEATLTVVGLLGTKKLIDDTFTPQNSPDPPFVSAEIDNDIPLPRVEDVTKGPHGPYRPIEEVYSRSRLLDKNGKPARGSGPQGRWLTEQAGYDAVRDLDVERMTPNVGYSVPIRPGAGTVLRPVNVYPPRTLVGNERYILDDADRAVVIRKPDGIHTYPIGPEHPDYGKQAPTR